MTTERTLPGLEISGYATPGETGWEAWADVNWRVLSIVAGHRVKSRTTELPGSPSALDIYIVPDDDLTNPNKIAVWDGPSGSEAWVYLDPMKGPGFYVEDDEANVQWDGTAWVEFAGGGGGSGNAYYDVIVGFVATPASSETVSVVPIVRELTLPADFTGAVGNCGTNPTSTFTALVKDDGTEIGTIEISTGGVFTFATDSGTEKVVAAGSILTLEGPATADATVADVTVTLLGEAS